LLVQYEVSAGTILGHLRDQNWYARRSTSDPFGVGQYEFAVNANMPTSFQIGGFDDTDVYGAFAMSNVVAGSYTVASWDVWWRSSYLFNVNVPSSGNSPDLDLRLNATMWGYPAFWDPAGYLESGQTFVATGPITMIYLRLPDSSGSYTLTVHTNGPGGAQVGQSRGFGVGDQRPIYGYGEMPTIADGTYYVRIRSSSPGTVMQMDPRPDFSDPMPGGCLWLGNGVTQTPFPDRDLGLTIMSDDDGLITDMFTRFTSGTNFSGVTNVGQSFIARGVSLISAAFWLADGTFPAYMVRLLRDGPGGAQVGVSRINKPARPTADSEMVVTWAPGECPLIPGQTYYLEVLTGAGTSVLINTANPFSYGQAYKNGLPVAGVDLAGTIMEEESAGSATRPIVKITSDPIVLPADRGANDLIIQWTTDVGSDSLIEYAAETPPYTSTLVSTQFVTTHSLTLTNLQSHTMYHYRVTSSALGYRQGISRDFVICTRPAGTNLLADPSFEEGSGASPRSTLVGWTKAGPLDIRMSDGSWLGNLKPTNGLWLLQGALNGDTSDSAIFQQVTNTVPGYDYTFSAWLMTGMQENGVYKYDVWNNQGRLIYMRLGVDPTGGTNVNAGTVQWTPRVYSHRHYTQLAKSAVAQGSSFTVFIHMKGNGSGFHLYAADDCALTDEEIPTRFDGVTLGTNNVLQSTVTSRANRSNVIETSLTATNNWSPVTNFLNRSGAMPFRYVVRRNENARFFRARTLP